jgi:RNA polymerase sigma-70 factor (ECF subfamily)
MKTNVHLISEQMTYFKAVVKRSLPSRYQHLAEDLAQDAILKAIEKIAYYDPSKGNFKSWLYRLTQNLCFDAIRKMDKMNTIPINCGILHVDTENKNIDRAEIKKIRNAMKYLSKRDQMLITYKFMFNLSGREMSQLLDIPEAQINVYFKRAKERLIEICKVAA